MLREQKGITMVTLIAMIIVLIILARVSIMSIIGDDGTMSKAKKTRLEAIAAEELEKVKLAAAEANGKDTWGAVTQEEMELYLTKNIGEKDKKYTIEAKDEGAYIVTFVETENKYIIDRKGDAKPYIEENK